tara:strand:+ start:757 stop:2637 length:1881 start_codon:yes stop_codon:yes gene_type:complete
MAITGVEMHYGAYQLKPAPIVTVGRELYKQHDGTILGGGYRVTLNGTLLPHMIVGTGLSAADAKDLSSIPPERSGLVGHNLDGPDNSMSVFRAKDDFLKAFNQDRRLFTVAYKGAGAACTGYPIYGAPRVISAEFTSEDQWTRKLDYSVELFFNNSMSTGTGIYGIGDFNTNPYYKNLTGILSGNLGSFEYIEGNLQSYSREYSVEVMAKGAQIGSGYLPTFFQIGISTQAQTLEGTGAPWGTGDSRGTHNVIRPAFVDGYNGVSLGAYKGGDIKWTGAGSLSEVMSGYLGTIPFSGLTGVHTDSSYSLNQAGGTYSYNDTVVAYMTTGAFAPSGHNGFQPQLLQSHPVIDTPSVSVEGALEDAIVSVTIQGELRGLSNFYGATNSGAIGKAAGVSLASQVKDVGPHKEGMVLSTALANAQRYLDFAAYQGSETGRQDNEHLYYNWACNVYSGLNFPSVLLLKLQVEPITQSISYNTREGTIGYSFTYTNRPQNCYSGALVEQISISRGNPSQVHANLTILGRAKGPILQDIATITAGTTEVNVEAVIVPDIAAEWDPGNNVSGLCSGWVFANAGNTRNFYSGFMTNVEKGISGEYGQYFVTTDSETYDPKTGRYTRSKAWIHSLC